MAMPKLSQLGLDETGMTDPKIIVAMDFPEPQQALDFASRVSPDQCRLKIGKELFTSAGPRVVEQMIEQGFDIFLDLKFHDIPNTVKKAAAAAAKLGVWMLNVHALGGPSMMLAAREGVDVVSKRPLLIAVTVLTSHTEEDLQRSGIKMSLPQLVEVLATNSLNSGLDGVVCSAQEAPSLRKSLGPSPVLVTPGIRPEWAVKDDQQRTVTPQKALADGVSYLVLGRPITQHADPAEALSLISDSIKLSKN